MGGHERGETRYRTEPADILKALMTEAQSPDCGSQPGSKSWTWANASLLCASVSSFHTKVVITKGVSMCKALRTEL